MPLYDFVCQACRKQFEELVCGDERPVCPGCGSGDVERLVSAPSPQKTGAFPFKPGPPLPARPSVGGGCPGGSGFQ